MYEQELRALRGILWTLSEELSTNQLAMRANLSHSTVARFFGGDTKNPSFRTISNLCHAVGVQVTITKKAFRLKVA